MNIKLALLFLSVMTLLVCSCVKEPNPPAEAEEDLSIKLNPDPGNTLVKALGSSYLFQVTVQSKMPAQGVTIAVDARKDSDGSSVFSQSLQTSTSPVDVTINNLPLNEIVTVSLTVTSKSKPTNTASKTFKLVRK